MSRRENSLAFFLIFFGLALIIIIVGKLGGISAFGELVSNSSLKVASLLNISTSPSGQIANLSAQNADLRKKLINNESLVAENKALRDQFSTTSISSVSLVPAKVVGSPGFIPGVSNPDYLIIAKGRADGLREGNAVIYQDNFVGTVVNVTENFSKVVILPNISSFTAKVMSEKDILGVVKGKGNSLVLDNVLLSENLKKDQLVVTKGDVSENGLGVPPGLVIGKIVSIEKKSSELFQRAEVESFVDFKNLLVVFVVK